MAQGPGSDPRNSRDQGHVIFGRLSRQATKGCSSTRENEGSICTGTSATLDRSFVLNFIDSNSILHCTLLLLVTSIPLE
jgi:hypothetical protein